MRRRSAIGIVAAWSAASCAVALALLGPARLQAEDPAAPRAEVATPVVRVGDVELSVRFATSSEPSKAAYGLTLPAGAVAKLELVAVNRGDLPAEATVTSKMLSMSRGSPVSRVVPAPKEVWQDDQVITLGPKETRAISLPDGPAMPAGSSATIVLNSAGQMPVAALRWSVPAAATDAPTIVPGTATAAATPAR